MFGSTNVNRFARQSRLNLPELKTLPNHPVLIQMLGLAQKNVGKTICLAWKAPGDPHSYSLEAIISPPSKEFIGRRSQFEVTDPQWTLRRRRDQDSSATEQLWSHASGDVGLILNLVTSETTGTNQETTETMLLTKAFGHDSLTGLQRFDSQQNNAPIVDQQSQTLPNEQAMQTMQAMQNVTLAGSLAEIELSGVLQSISICKMTGRLDVQDRLSQAEIYFDDGTLVHAVCQSALNLEDITLQGETVLLDVLSWVTGSFFFHRARKTSERSIKRRLEGLLLEGASLRDYLKHLDDLGLTEESILHKVGETLSDKELDEKIQAGIPVDVTLQKLVYHEVDGKTSFQAIADRLGLHRTRWAAIIFNLLTCELVTLDRDAKTHEAIHVDTVQIDHSLAAEAGRNLYRPETGLLGYPLLLYFMDQEFARQKAGDSHFSIVFFELKNKSESLSNKALQQMAECFGSLKRKFDILGHYLMLDFIMVLPLRTDEEAHEFVQEFVTKITQCELDSVKSVDDLKFADGIASVPADRDDLAKLITAAKEAKDHCLSQKVLCRTVREISWEEHKTKAEAAAREQNLNDAETYWAEAVKDARGFASDDPRLISSMEALASIYLERTKYAKAEALYSQLVQIKGRGQEGSNSMAVAQAVADLARCYYMQGKYDETEPLLVKVVELFERQLGPTHPTVATGLYNLASLYHVQQKYNEAEPVYKRALDLRRQSLGVDHPDTQKIELNYLSLLKTRGADNSEISFITGTWKALEIDKPETKEESS